MLRVLLWSLLAWPLPALVAGGAGWKGVWGSGSALVDYLIPLPVAGGALHVPSFALATVAVALMPRLKAIEIQRARFLALGAAIAGALMVFEWPSGRVQQNPLGLFLLSDGALAFIVLSLSRQRPWLRVDLLSLLLVAGPTALLATVLWRMSPNANDFNTGHAMQDASHTRTTIYVHTTLKPSSPGFRATAEAWAATHQHPKQWGDVEEAALLFLTDRAASLAGQPDAAFATLCQYEDDTPSRWVDGAGDCFAGRVSFAEQIKRAAAAQAADLPAEVRDYLGLKATCAAAPPMPPGPLNNGITRVERCMNLENLRAWVAKRHPGLVP